MSWLLAGAAIAGTGLQIYGQAKEADERKEAAEQQAQANRLQARELMRQQSVEEVGRKLEKRDQLDALSRSVAGGVAARSGSALRARNEVVEMAEWDILESRRNARFMADQVRQGAMEMEQAADRISRARDIGIAQTILTSGAQVAAQQNMGPSGNQQLLRRG